MGRRRKPRVGDEVSFTFAGTQEKGKIIKINGKGKSLRYLIDDGKYKYPVTYESISK